MKTCKENNPIPLDQLCDDSIVSITAILGDKSFISRAVGRGFTPGTKLIVVQNFRIGPLIVYLRDTQVALGRREAKNIMVATDE